MAAQQAASVLHSFPFRAGVLALCIALLPLLPAQVPEGIAAGAGVGQAFLAKAWELLHLLVVGIAVSYGLFSRKNSADDGRAGGAAAAANEKDTAAVGPGRAKADARYLSRMFRDSLAPFDDDEDEEEVLVPERDTPPGGDDGGGGGSRKVRSWSALHHPDEPVVVVSNGTGGRSSHAAHAQAALSLPVRTLKPQPAQDANMGGGESLARPHRGSPDSVAGDRDETVLPSPIPWRSRSGRLDTDRPASPSPSPSPKRLSPASSSSKEALASSFDGSSSSTAAPVGKSVRTIRAREAAVLQGPSRELPDDAPDGREAPGVDEPEQPYGYREYQSIPRFQYERSVSDPILGGVAVSSDETESSDDDDDDVGGTGAYSTRESTPEVDENEVDKKAEEFIARFREQIRRQRIESIKRSAGPRGVKHGK